MGNNKVKTAGQMQGKKGNGQSNLHPKSRRLKQTIRVDLRNQRVGQSKKARQHVEFEQINRLLWFVRELQTIDPDRTHLEPFEMHELAQRFLDRLDDELEAETKARRQGRPKSKRQEELEAAKVRDALEYERQGLLMPDLSDKVSIISLRYWLDTLDGRSGYLKRLRLIRLFKGKTEFAVVQQGERPPQLAYANVIPDPTESIEYGEALRDEEMDDDE